MNLALRFRETLERVHPALVGEFDAVIASILAGWSREHGPDDRHRRVSLEAIRSLEPTETPIEVDSGLRFLRGPWVFERDGNVVGHAVLRPPPLTADAHDYDPAGFRDAIVLELSSTRDVTVTGLHIGVRAGGRRKRLVVLLNVGDFTIRLKHEDAASAAPHRFLVAGAAVDYPLGAGESIWLYYDTHAQRWRPFGLRGGATGGASATGSRWVFLGGDMVSAVRSAGPTWTPATPFQVQIDTTGAGNLAATVTAWVRAAAGSVQARLKNVSDNTVAGTSGPVTPAGWADWRRVTFGATLASGAKLYQLELLPSLADTDVAAWAYLE
jgi:hypothetical protein